ncbi:MAG: HAD family hydrolase [Haloarculaceae archaeon]
MSEYDAVLFDSDGVVVEPPARETQTEATRAAFREVGVADVDPGHVAAVVDGATLGDLREIRSAYDLDPEAFWAARERLDERSQFDAFRAGERDRYDDVAAIADLPAARGVVSNNHHSTIEFVLEFFGLGSLFDTHYGREKTIESLRLKKPNPHYLERALADLDAADGEALYVGDSGSDVLAARRAGIDSALVRRPGRRTADRRVTPTHEIGTLHELADIVDG